MPTAKPLDFAIIGAQKSATTSMFKYLVKHPRIHMPPEKEVPFFSRDDLYEAGWPAFVDTYFANADPNRLWGVASPQYMADPRAPQRMHAANPHTKLIALLRNPIDRAYSHYNMSLRRNMEQRDFDQAIEELLQPDLLAACRTAIPPDYAQGYAQSAGEVNRYYLVWSEYARALERFLQHFPQQQLLVLYMEDMKRDPQASLAAVMAFLDLPTDFQPANLGKVYHKGGGRQIIPDAWKDKIKRNGAFRLVWDRFPARAKGVFNYWYDQLNVRKASGEAGPSAQARKRLAQHFRDDVRRVEALAGKSAPWREFQG
jgi:hypothetical protein